MICDKNVLKAHHQALRVRKVKNFVCVAFKALMALTLDVPQSGKESRIPETVIWKYLQSNILYDCIFTKVLFLWD